MFVGRRLLVGVVLWSVNFMFVFADGALKVSDVSEKNVALLSVSPVADVAKKGGRSLKKPKSRFVRVTRRVLSGMSSGIGKVLEWKPMQIPAVIGLAISLFILREKWNAYNNEKKKDACKNDSTKEVTSKSDQSQEDHIKFLSDKIASLEAELAALKETGVASNSHRNQEDHTKFLSDKIASLETELAALKVTGATSNSDQNQVAYVKSLLTIMKKNLKKKRELGRIKIKKKKIKKKIDRAEGASNVNSESSKNEVVEARNFLNNVKGLVAVCEKNLRRVV